MKQFHKQSRSRFVPAFTLVELIIVIVVIAILAAITIVAYNGIQQRAVVASLISDLENSNKQLLIYLGTNNALLTSINCTASPPANTICLKNSSGNTYQYIPAYTSSPQSFCLSATNGAATYFIVQGTTPASGTCANTNGLVGWWTFNTNANDSMTSGDNGVVSGATLTTGQNGQSNGAYSFDGISNTITLPQQLPTSLSQFTVSAWVKVVTGSGSTDGYGYIVHRGSSSSVGGSIYWLGVNPAGHYAATANGVLASSDTGVNADTTNWHLLTLTYDGSQQVVYVDGVQKIAVTIGTITNQTTSNQTAIDGTPFTVGYRPVAGTIDDVRIYNRALSASEVTAMYTAGAQ